MSYLSHFWRYRLEKYVHIYQPLHYKILTVFENFDFDGVNFEKENKLLKMLGIFRNFQNFEIRDSSFVARIVLR